MMAQDTAQDYDQEQIFQQFDALAQAGNWNGLNEFEMKVEQDYPELAEHLIETLNADQLYAYSKWHRDNECGHDQVVGNQ